MQTDEDLEIVIDSHRSVTRGNILLRIITSGAQQSVPRSTVGVPAIEDWGP